MAYNKGSLDLFSISMSPRFAVRNLVLKALMFPGVIRRLSPYTQVLGDNPQFFFGTLHLHGIDILKIELYVSFDNHCLYCTFPVCQHYAPRQTMTLPF